MGKPRAIVTAANMNWRRRGISFSAQGFAFFNALVLAKVMLVAEDLDLGRWLQRRPLIYPILHESLLLTVLFICCAGL